MQAFWPWWPGPAEFGMLLHVAYFGSWEVASDATATQKETMQGSENEKETRKKKNGQKTKKVIKKQKTENRKHFWDGTKKQIPTRE